MNPLEELLTSRVRAALLRILFGLDKQEYHVREIARRSGLSLGTVRQDLKKMSRLDLITARRSGNRLYYRANLDHPLYGDLRNIVLKTSGLVDILREKLGTKDIKAAFVFGSIAEGKEKAGSDVDLMVIGDIGLRETSERLSGASEEIGREINPYALTVKEFGKRLREKGHFLTSVMESPKIFIVGGEDELEGMG